MFTTIDIHISDDTFIEVNESKTGLVIREATSYEPRLTLYLGTDRQEIDNNIEGMIQRLMELRAAVKL